MFTSLPKVHEVAVGAPACVTPWGSLVKGHGMGLGVHPLTRLNRFTWEDNAEKTVGMCSQVTREWLLGLPLPQVS